jgi:hypothetical protein
MMTMERATLAALYHGRKRVESKRNERSYIVIEAAGSDGSGGGSSGDRDSRSDADKTGVKVWLDKEMRARS